MSPAPPAVVTGGPDSDVAHRSDADAGLRLNAFLFEQLFKRPPTLIAGVPGGLTISAGPTNASPWPSR